MQNQPTPIEIRRRFATAFRLHPSIYWSDLLVSVGVGWVAFMIGGQAQTGSPLHFVATTVAVVALLRAAVFIHELAHLKRGVLPGFETAWHLLVGLPLLLPSLMYVGSHSDHHRQTTFGTAADPEYAPVAKWGCWRIAWFVASVLAVPFLLVLRWGVLGPLSYLIPWLRRPLIERASTLVINSDYHRPSPQGRQVIRWMLQETAATMVCWLVAVGWLTDWIPTHWLLHWYIIASGILLVNQVRTLAAHRYDNNGTPVDLTTQLLDSVTLSGWSIPTVFAAPLGLRYHTLHHLLPTVPYHSLGTLHRQLMTELPLDAPYRRTQCSGILAAVRNLIQHGDANRLNASNETTLLSP